MPKTNPLEFTELQHLQVFVDDLDDAAEFYSEVFGFIETHSHFGLNDRSIASWFGLRENPEDLDIDLRFMFVPDVITLKLVRLRYRGARPSGGNADAFALTNRKAGFSGLGLGPVSMVVKDIDEAYKTLVSVAQNYGNRWNVRISGPPTYCDAIRPDQIGATPNSAVHGQQALLERLASRFPTRANFHAVDPFGVHWVFAKDVL